MMDALLLLPDVWNQVCGGGGCIQMSYFVFIVWESLSYALTQYLHSEFELEKFVCLCQIFTAV